MALPRKIPGDLRESLSLKAYKDAWDDIDVMDEVILITWSPKPRFYNYSPHIDNDYAMQWRTMINVLVNTRCLRLFCFMPEISDEGRLHMHGWFVINDKVKYHKSFLPSLKRNGFIKKNKANSHGWKTFEYHTKDIASTCKYLPGWEELPITHHNRDVFNEEIQKYKLLQAKTYDVKPKIMKQNVLFLISKSNGGIEFENI